MTTSNAEYYTKQEIADMLKAKDGTRNVRFRYDLLDKNDNYKDELTQVVSGSVDLHAFADIKRTANFRLREDDTKVEKLIARRTTLRDYQGMTLGEVDNA